MDILRSTGSLIQSLLRVDLGGKEAEPSWLGIMGRLGNVVIDHAHKFKEWIIGISNHLEKF